MSKTFSVLPGIMGQSNTASAIVSVLLALTMGILSIRFNHRILMLTGMLSFSIGAIGCYLAWDLNSMLIFYSLNGAASAMVIPMTNTLIGDNFVPAKRTSAVGWTVAAGSLAYFIGAPLMGVLSEMGGWRIVLLSFIIPISLLSLLMMGTATRSATRDLRTDTAKESYAKSFLKIISNRSAAGCLAGTIFRYMVFAALLFYGAAFTIEWFGLSTDLASVVVLLAALSYSIGSLTSNRVITALGRKSSSIAAALLAGVFTISYAYASSVWLSVALMCVAGWFDGLAASAATSLTLEQLPQVRGTMMSLSYAFVGLGSALGGAIGGFTLIFYNYQMLGIIMGSMGILAAVIFQLATVDPIENTFSSL